MLLLVNYGEEVAGKDWEEKIITKGHKESFGCVDMFIILIVVKPSQVCTHVKA